MLPGIIDGLLVTASAGQNRDLACLFGFDVEGKRRFQSPRQRADENGKSVQRSCFLLLEEDPLRGWKQTLRIRDDLMQLEGSGPKEVEGARKEAVEGVLVEHIQRPVRLPMVAGVRVVPILDSDGAPA